MKPEIIITHPNLIMACPSLGSYLEWSEVGPPTSHLQSRRSLKKTFEVRLETNPSSLRNSAATRKDADIKRRALSLGLLIHRTSIPLKKTRFELELPTLHPGAGMHRLNPKERTKN
jgi:hypothetical protein